MENTRSNISVDLIEISVLDSSSRVLLEFFVVFLFHLPTTNVSRDIGKYHIVRRNGAPWRAQKHAVGTTQKYCALCGSKKPDTLCSLRPQTATFYRRKYTVGYSANVDGKSVCSFV